MQIEVCKWFDDARSPVFFMVDDLANVWVDTNGNGEIDRGEDWGYAKWGTNSSIRYLEEELLYDFPWVKATFFVPVGRRVGVISNPSIKSISRKINYDGETKNFFKSLNENPRYELAYHGTTHGMVGERTEDFKQEWELFSSLREAQDGVKAGKEIFKDAVGVYPRGGKYCGYISNEFSDESINSTGFLWWCRYSNISLKENKESKIGGDDHNPITNFNTKFFGSNYIVDIPTTVNGSMLSSVFKSDCKSVKGILKKVLKGYLIRRKLKHIDFLMENRLVISIQQHIAPSRNDGRRQMPNIFDDREGLKTLFQYLRTKDVWYCTGTELAKYVSLRDNIKLIVCFDNKFRFELKQDMEHFDTTITLKLKGYSGRRIKLPDGKEVLIRENKADIRFMDGIYELI